MTLPVSLCAPSILFLVLGIIVIIMFLFHKVHVVTLLIQIVFIAFWTFILNFLCQNDFTVVSWILLLLPFIFITLMVIAGVFISKKTVDFLEYKEENIYT
jgi:hypothetical protein